MAKKDKLTAYKAQKHIGLNGKLKSI